MDHLSKIIYYRTTVGYIHKHMIYIFRLSYALLRMFIVFDPGVQNSPKTIFLKNVDFVPLNTSAGGMVQA